MDRSLNNFKCTGINVLSRCVSFRCRPKNTNIPSRSTPPSVQLETPTRKKQGEPPGISCLEALIVLVLLSSHELTQNKELANFTKLGAWFRAPHLTMHLGPGTSFWKVRLSHPSFGPSHRRGSLSHENGLGVPSEGDESQGRGAMSPCQGPVRYRRGQV